MRPPGSAGPARRAQGSRAVVRARAGWYRPALAPIAVTKGRTGVAFADRATQARLQVELDRHREAAEAQLTRLRALANGRDPPDIGGLLRDYVLGRHGYIDHALHTARRLIDMLARKAGALPAETSLFGRFGALRPEAVERHCPELRGDLFELRDTAAVATRMLLEPCANEVLDLSFPVELACPIRQPQRPALRLYSSDDAAVFAHPFQYQILSRDGAAAYETGSPRALSRHVTRGAERIAVDRPVVVVQDRFAFLNFSHFLFDGVTRILHYLEHCGGAGRPLFVLGSIAGDYHTLVLDKLAERAGIPADSFWFPDRACLLTTTGSVHWFSDQVETFSHPAQMVHPRSLTAIGALAAALPVPRGEVRRLYVSRGDATRRRVLNEPELIAALEQRGFTSVQLAKLPVAEQIGLFRGAEIVVGPHGMGMTHVAMGERLGRMVELFPRWGGTAAYAWVAKAAGVDYHLHAGPTDKHGNADFTVEVARVLDLIGPDEARPRRPMWRKAANLIADSRGFGGFRTQVGGSDAVPAGIACDPPVWGLQPRIHVRSALAVQTAVGGWEGITVIPGCDYTLSAYVFIPSEYAGDRVGLRITSWTSQAARNADLGQRGVWQRIWVTARAPDAARSCGALLQVTGPANTWVASAAWQLERGAAATGFVATG
jgi:hypothetical protein